MKILALEFSSPQRSVAVLQGAHAPPRASFDAPSNKPVSVSEVVATDLRSAALGLIDDLLHEAKLEREQIDCLAVGLGPGSYTGIRAAIALAQGWQLANGVKLLGVSSAECLAAQAQADGFVGRINVVMDAQREEFYLAGYELGATGWREIAPLRLAPLAEVRERERAGEVLTGPEVTRWFPSGRNLFPRAATLARLAVRRNDFVAGEKLEPIYLRETRFVKAPPPRVNF